MEATSGDIMLAEADARKAWIDSDYSNGGVGAAVPAQRDAGEA